MQHLKRTANGHHTFDKTEPYLTKVFDGHDIRVVRQDKEVWLVAADVCDVLEIDKVSRNVRGRMRKNADGRRYLSGGLDDDEWATWSGGNHTAQAHPNGGNPPLQSGQLLVNQFGVYQLILKSSVEGAKRMKRWLTHEVIPSIQTTGSYPMQQSPAPDKPGISEELQKTMQQTQEMIQQLVVSTTTIQKNVGLAHQKAEDAKEVAQEVEQKLQNRQIAEDLRERSAESMRAEIRRLVNDAVKAGHGHYAKLYNMVYDDVADHVGLDPRQKYEDRGSRSVLQMLTTNEMAITLQSARALYD